LSITEAMAYDCGLKKSPCVAISTVASTTIACRAIRTTEELFFMLTTGRAINKL
jgi:hypothetical protein